MLTTVAPTIGPPFESMTRPWIFSGSSGFGASSFFEISTCLSTIRDRSVAFRYGDAQRGVDQIVVVEKGEFALRFDGFEHVEDRSVRHFDGQPLPLLCMKRCGDAVCCKERHAAKQDPEAFPDVVKVFHKVF